MERGTVDEDSGDEEDEDAGGWGSSKRDYYNADNIETEADALAEEAEAKRLQQKKLQKMTDADFGFDESEWLDTAQGDEDGDVVTEVLRDIEITPTMGSEERMRLLQTRYPEFEFLANEFLELQPLLDDLQAQADAALGTAGSTAKPSPAVVKSRALAAYLGALTMYFAILTSNATDSDGASPALDPMELRDHPVMDTLLQCRELWAQVKTLSTAGAEDISVSEDDSVADVPMAVDSETELNEAPKASKKSKKALAAESAKAQAAAQRKEHIRLAEEGLADLTSLLPKSSKSGKKTAKAAVVVDDDSDFGEEESLGAHDAAEKAKKKKSLRFYTSQIAQKANRRADAGRDAGGDADLPYRERLKDRQARLNAEAERRGKKLDEYGRGADLGGDSGDEDGVAATEVRDDEDEYYDMVSKTTKGRKADKAEKYEAYAAAKEKGATVRVVEGEVGEDGKRAIGYVIEKNKGLAPRRKKEVRNPRVKKKLKYEEKMKKLSSTRAVYKGGEGRGGYGGEKTGIKSGLVKSIKL